MYPFDSIFLASEPHRPLFEFIFLVSEGFYYQPDVTSWASLRTIKGRCGTGRGRSSSVGGSKRSVPAIRTCLIQSGAGASTGLGVAGQDLFELHVKGLVGLHLSAFAAGEIIPASHAFLALNSYFWFRKGFTTSPMSPLGRP